MRRFVLAIALLVALPAIAADHTLTFTAPMETKSARALVLVNAQTCASVGLAAGCSNAAVQAKDPSKRIFANVDALATTILREQFDELGPKADVFDEANALVAIKAASGATKNQICALVGLPNGCLP
jgi:hypothetical protein